MVAGCPDSRRSEGPDTMVPKSHCLAVLAALLLICGCYNPYPYQGWRGQPGYYPAQPGQLQTPGQLYIPESDAPLAAPGQYDSTEDPDDFGRDDERYYGGDRTFEEDSDGAVPPPRESGGASDGFDGDFNGF